MDLENQQKTELVIQQELNPGESLLWSGRPKQGIIFRGADVLLIPFSLLWGGFVVFWESMAIKSGSLFMQLWGVPFILVGLYIIVGRFFLDVKQRQHTYYGVTNQRIIIITKVFVRKIKTLSLKTLSDITVTEKRDKRGTIAFGPTNFMGWRYGIIWWYLMNQQALSCFELIDDAKNVYEKIRSAQK